MQLSDMKQAIGVIETYGMPTALVAADALAKAAAVQILGFENTQAGRISVLIQGDTGAVKTAISSVIHVLPDQPSTILAHHIIPCPDQATTIRTLIQERNRLGAQENEAEWLDD